MIESKLSDKIVGYQPTVDASHQMSGVLNCLVLVQDSDHQDRDQDGESTVSRLFRRDSILRRQSSLTEEVCGPACMALNLLRFHGIGFHVFTNRHLQYVDMRWMSDKRYHTVPCEIQVHYLTSNVPCLSGLYDICNMQLSA